MKDPRNDIQKLEHDTLLCNGRPLDEVHAALKSPFLERELEFLPKGGSKGGGDRAPTAMVLTYVNRTAVIRRLDSVVGCGHWRAEYREHKGGVVCRLSIRAYTASNFGVQPYDAGSNGWLFKEDGADESNIESTKGGISNALKRAASAWGIGLYLYDLPKLVIPGKLVSRGNRDAIYPKEWEWERRLRAEWHTGQVAGTTIPPHCIHDDDRTGEHLGQSQSLPERDHQAPTGMPQDRAIYAKGAPDWLFEKIGGRSTFADRDWEYMCAESSTGGRDKQLLWMATECKNKKLKDRAKVVMYFKDRGKWLAINEWLSSTDVAGELEKAGQK